MKSTGTLPTPGLKTELYLFGLIYWMVCPETKFLEGDYEFLVFLVDFEFIDILDGEDYDVNPSLIS